MRLSRGGEAQVVSLMHPEPEPVTVAVTEPHTMQIRKPVVLSLHDEVVGNGNGFGLGQPALQLSERLLGAAFSSVDLGDVCGGVGCDPSSNRQASCGRR